jgi:hypothetical protein
MQVTSLSLKLRPFFCPIAAACHPEAAHLNNRTIRWVEYHRLYTDEAQKQRLERVNAGLLAALTSPNGALEPTQISTDSLMWLFAFDDAHCDEGQLGRDPLELSRVLARLLRILEAPEVPLAPSSPYRNFELALRDLRSRIAMSATPLQVQRWIDAMRMYFMLQVWEAANRVEKSLPDLNEYAFMRIHNGAMRVSVMLLDIADGYELPALDMDRPDVRALTEATCLLVGWDNDLLSFHKEHTRAEGAAGLLDILAHARGTGPEEVLDEAMLLRDQVMVLFERLGRQVTATASPALTRYVSSLGNWIRANLEWGSSCARYVDPAAPGHLSEIWATNAAVGSGTPIDLPSINWWWQQLTE